MIYSIAFRFTKSSAEKQYDNLWDNKQVSTKLETKERGGWIPFLLLYLLIEQLYNFSDWKV